MNYTPKTDWVDYDANNPSNPKAIPMASDILRFENGINDAKNEINTHTTSINNIKATTNIFNYNNFGGAL